MDLYHSVHGHDISTFDIQSTHRLPAVSAAQALEDLNGDPSQCVSTGLCELDRALAGALPSPIDEGLQPNEALSPLPSGVQRGQVTEFWGPPGAGKTAMGIQLAAAVMCDERGVVWVDCTFPVCGRRLTDAATAVKSARSSDESQSPRRGASPEDGTRDRDVSSDGFVHYTCATLAHFIALLCKPAATALPSNTSLVVIDSLSALINGAYPRDGKKDVKGTKGPGFGTRRLQTLQYIISALQKLAATRECAVVVLSQCATRMQSESGATLVPAVNASVWDQGVASRVVLFKDFVWSGGTPIEVCFAGIQKLAGKATTEPLGQVFGFKIEKTGLVSFRCDDVQAAVATAAIPLPKRKLADTDFEIPDSEDDDYGWDSEDARHLPPDPPQWQGSEDLIIGTQKYRSDNENEDEDEDEGEGEDEDGVGVRSVGGGDTRDAG